MCTHTGDAVVTQQVTERSVSENVVPQQIQNCLLLQSYMPQQSLFELFLTCQALLNKFRMKGSRTQVNGKERQEQYTPVYK